MKYFVRVITDTMVLLYFLITFGNDTDVSESCLDHKPQSFYWDAIQLHPSNSAIVICQ